MPMPDAPWLYRLFADGVLLLHAGVVIFIVGGLFLVLLGGMRNWTWVKNLWFRRLHVAAIGYVVVATWLGVECPLTTLELWLRARAGQAAHHEDFIAHWLRVILFFEAPPWVFTAVYSVFGVLVLFSWIRVRPGRHLLG